MKTRPIEKADFDHIVEVIDHWWGGPISTFAHPIFFYELGGQALVAEEDGRMIGFLLGFVAEAAHVSAVANAVPGARTGYVHLVGIHPEYRRRGVGRLLYEKFTEACLVAGCDRMKAITTPGNEGSLRFHLAVGWKAAEDEHYAGLSRRRIVFTRDMPREGRTPSGRHALN